MNRDTKKKCCFLDLNGCPHTELKVQKVYLKKKKTCNISIFEIDPYQISENIFTDLKLAQIPANLTFADIYIFNIQSISIYCHYGFAP